MVLSLVICLLSVLTTVTYIMRNKLFCFNQQFFCNLLSFNVEFQIYSIILNLWVKLKKIKTEHIFKFLQCSRYNICNITYNQLLSFSSVSQVTCQAPYFSDNLHISTDKRIYNYSETIRFSCSEGFFLQGTSERTCKRSGTLQPPFPKCTGTKVSYRDYNLSNICYQKSYCLVIVVDSKR